MFSRGNLSEILRRTVIQGTAQYGDCLGIRKNYGDIFSLWNKEKNLKKFEKKLNEGNLVLAAQAQL